MNCFIIGEIAQAHDGSLGTAHAYIDAIADAGADAVKFQTHIASAESTPAEPFRTPFSQQDDSRYEYWKRMEFTPEQWAGLAKHTRERGLTFLSSPFSIEAAELLENIGVSTWKIASGEVATPGLLGRLLATGQPIIMSTGMSSLAEIDRIVDRVRAAGNALTLLQCTSAYPCPAEHVGLNLLGIFRDRYGCPVGLSDHSGTPYPALAAAVLGASVVEVHVTFSRKTFGPDVPASLTLEELREMVEGVRFIETMLANPVDKDQMAARLQPLRDLFTKSLVAKEDLAAGTILESKHLVAKKPGTGISPERIEEVLGARLLRNVAADELLELSDLEGIEP